METVGAYEAKTHLPKLLERVSKGEQITITKHGVPVALLQPPVFLRRITVFCIVNCARQPGRRLSAQILD